VYVHSIAFRTAPACLRRGPPTHNFSKLQAAMPQRCVRIASPTQADAAVL